VAISGALLIHVPPLTASVNKVVPSTQISAMPDITDGPLLLLLIWWLHSHCRSYN
jgi:hypothetical protein